MSDFAPVGQNLYFAYIDEAGDRGWGGRSTNTFVLSSVIVHENDVASVLAFRNRICDDLNKPRSTELHWAENLKAHTQRKYASHQLGQQETLTASTVVVHKPSLMGRGSGLSDHARMYNYAVRRMLERLSWFARDRKATLIPTFAHVRRFPYEKLSRYLGVLKLDRTEIVWSALGQHRIEQPKKRLLLQVADITAGSTFAAVEPDAYGNFESTYLLIVEDAGSAKFRGFRIGSPGRH